MKLLFLGGTGFVGRHMVAEALKRGHEVTLFTRNKTNVDIFPQVERLQGDRDGNLDALKGRKWDAVLDINSYIPRLVNDSAKLLQNQVDHYLFISAGCACISEESVIKDETAKRVILDNPETEEYWGPAYCGLKALCERQVEAYFPSSAVILRLGVVAGPHDPTDRVTYWVDRVARGGEVLIPAKPDDSLAFIDARDLAEFTLTLLETKAKGIFHAFGQLISWREWLQACKQLSGSDAEFTWIDDQTFLTEHINFQPRLFGALPMMPAAAKSKTSFNCDKAIAAGLYYRSPENTARDILLWQNQRVMQDQECGDSLEVSSRKSLDWGGTDNRNYWMAGLTPEQEKQLLLEWRVEID